MQRRTRRDPPRGAGSETAGSGGPGSIESDDAEGINVLLIMADQLTFCALGAAGNEHIQTPNLDRLAAQGARFEVAGCPAPFCSPSRASIVTGLHPPANGVLFNVEKWNQAHQKRLDEVGVPMTEQILHDRGYATAHRGTWHLGDKANLACYRDLPAEMDHGYAGIDYDAFLAERMPASELDDAQADARVGNWPVYMTEACKAGHEQFLAWPERIEQAISIMGRTTVPPELMPEACITNQAMDVIERNAENNWMVTVSWEPPHAYWVAPEPYYSLHDRSRMPGADDRDKLPEWMRDCVGRKLCDWIGPDGVREYQGIYYGLVAMLDAEVGRLLAKLDELNLADRTLVIFTSDHGDMQGRFGVVGKGVSAFYDEVVRVPLLMRLPGRIEPGTVVGEQASLVDLMPTILDYAGVECPGGIHGLSLRPLLEGRAGPWRRFIFSQRTIAPLDRPDLQRMIRSQEHKYCFYGNGQAQLFDLVHDPRERENLFDDRSQRSMVRYLHEELRKWAAQIDHATHRALPADPLA